MAEPQRRYLIVECPPGKSGSSRLTLLLPLLLVLGHATNMTEKTASLTTKPNLSHDGGVKTLISGSSIEQDIPGVATQVYEIELIAGQQLRARFMKQDLDVAITLWGPQGQVCGGYISRRYGPIRISHVAEASGDYRLAVKSLEKGEEPRHYRLDAQVKRATDRDRKYDFAMKEYAEAEQLCAQWEEKALRQAILKYRSASASWESLQDYRQVAEAQEGLGEVHFILGEYPHALEAYNKALSARMASKDRLGEIASFNSLGYVYIYLGNNHTALRYLNKALGAYNQWRSVNRGNEDLRREAQVINSLGEVYYSLSDVKKTKESFDRALALWTVVGDRRGQALVHLNLGYLYYDIGDLEEAKHQYESAQRLWQAVDNRRGEALSCTALGGVHSFLGEKQLALTLHNRALDLFHSIGNLQGAVVSLNGIGAVYESLNEPQIALDTYKRALELNRSIGNSEFEAIADIYVGRVYRSMGQVQPALDYYNRSLRLVRQVGNRRIETYVLKYIATVYDSIGARQTALERYHKALMLYGKFKDKRGQANTLNSIGDIHYLLGEPQKALRDYTQALSFSHLAEDRAGEISALYNIARAERAIGNMEAALSRIDASIKLIENVRANVTSPDWRASYFALVRKHYEFYIDLLMQMQKRHPEARFLSEALYASERSRARSLLEMLVEAKVDIRQGTDPALIERESVLLRLLNTKAEYQMRLLSKAHTKEEATEIENDIRELTTQYMEVQAHIRAQSPLYSRLVQPRLLHPEEVQTELLDDHTLLLEYWLGDERSYLWAVSSTSVTGFELPSRAAIEEAAGDVYKLVIARQRAQEPTSAAAEENLTLSDDLYWQHASALSRILLEQVANQLHGKRLLIVVEGTLQRIPFEALPIALSSECQNGEALLPIAPDDDRVPLVLEHEVIYLPSASLLAALRETNSRAVSTTKVVAVFADPVFERDDQRVRSRAPLQEDDDSKLPEMMRVHQALKELEGSEEELSVPRLPSTLQEAKDILKIAPNGSGMMAVDFDANWTKATSTELDQYQIIHFATHGIINDEHPELSGIILSLINEHGGRQNGFLRLPDIYKLNLNVELVVLSACRSGLGKNIKGEGIVGLTQGFMYAGSKSVIASLWKVDDEATAELMKYFYSAMLKDGLPPATALQRAKQAMWRNKRWRSPFYWAAFVLQGEYDTSIKFDRPASPLAHQIMIASLVLLLLGIGFYVVRRVKRSRC